MEMFVLKVTVQVLLLVSLFGDLDANLICQCTGTCTANKTIECSENNEVCFAAELRTNNGTVRVEKGCKEQSECDISNCPRRDRRERFCKVGCCNYNNCEVNYTLSKDFEPSSSTMKPVMVISSPTLAIKPSSPAEMATTSFAQAKMTTKPMMPTTKMSEVKPMTSSQPDVKPTGSKKSMMSSSKKVNTVLKSRILQRPTTEPGDNRPTCGSGQVFSTVVVIAIGLLCTIF